MPENMESTGGVSDEAARAAEEAVSRQEWMNHRMRAVGQRVNRQIQEVEKHMPDGRKARLWMRRNQEWTTAATFGTGLLVGYGLAAWLNTPPPTFRERMGMGAQKLARQVRTRTGQTSESALRTVERASGTVRKQVNDSRVTADDVGSAARLMMGGLALRAISRWARRA